MLVFLLNNIPLYFFRFGWIVLNAPAQKSIWEYLESKNLTPNNVIYSQEVNCPSYLTTMICACEQYCEYFTNIDSYNTKVHNLTII